MLLNCKKTVKKDSVFMSGTKVILKVNEARDTLLVLKEDPKTEKILEQISFEDFIGIEQKTDNLLLHTTI